MQAEWAEPASAAENVRARWGSVGRTVLRGVHGDTNWSRCRHQGAMGLGQWTVHMGRGGSECCQGLCVGRNSTHKVRRKQTLAADCTCHAGRRRKTCREQNKTLHVTNAFGGFAWLTLEFKIFGVLQIRAAVFLLKLHQKKQTKYCRMKELHQTLMHQQVEGWKYLQTGSLWKI